MPEVNYTPIIVVDTTGIDECTWHEFRRKGIGGSDVAAVYGQSPFCTTRDLYYTKIGVKPVIEAKKYGHLLEDLVVEIFSHKTGLRVYKKSYLYAHPDYPFMQANVDYFVEMPDGSEAILECKTCNYNCRDKWDNGAVPFNYELQVRHYMAVTNIGKAFVACLYGNNDAKPELKHGSRIFRLGDRVLQTRNMAYISNGDVGFVKSVYIGEDNDSTITVSFGDCRSHEYGTDELDMLELAYAMTIHKSQGSEYDTVIIPMMSSHYIMLRRNLIYTAITRAKKKVIIVGQKKALYMAINKNDIDGRNTHLADRIQKLRQE